MKREERCTIRSISMPDNKWREIETTAVKSGIPLSGLIREAIDSYLDNHNKQKEKS